MTSISDILKESAKAITALLTSYLVVFAAKHGVTLSEAQVNDVVGPIIVGLITWFIPNVYRVTTRVHRSLPDPGSSSIDSGVSGSSQ